MIKRFIQLVCETLEIEIPKVSYDTSKFRTETMMAYCDGETIYVKNLSKPNPDVFFAVAHELRHLWQFKADKQLYFDNYKEVGETDVESYNLQPAEIDANAFATIVMADYFGIRPLYQGMSDKVIAAISKRVDEIINT